MLVLADAATLLRRKRHLNSGLTSTSGHGLEREPAWGLIGTDTLPGPCSVARVKLALLLAIRSAEMRDRENSVAIMGALRLRRPPGTPPTRGRKFNPAKLSPSTLGFPSTAGQQKTISPLRGRAAQMLSRTPGGCRE